MSGPTRTNQPTSASVGSNARPATPFRERFGYYLMGVAIGCLLVAMMWSARTNLRPKPVGAPQAPTQTIPPGAVLPSQQRGATAP